MTIALWIVQIVLALIFVLVGFMKASQPFEKLTQRMHTFANMAPVVPRLLGTAEILGAVGLIVPVATNILPWLTPIAAVCLGIIIIGATVVHARGKETQQASITTALLLLLLFVAIGRFALMV